MACGVPTAGTGLPQTLSYYSLGGTKGTGATNPYNENGFSVRRAEIYVARGCRKVNDVQPDGVEAYAKLEVLEMDPHELMTMINEGDIRVDPTLAQALLILNHRRLVKLA